MVVLEARSWHQDGSRAVDPTQALGEKIVILVATDTPGFMATSLEKFLCFPVDFSCHSVFGLILQNGNFSTVHQNPECPHLQYYLKYTTNTLLLNKVIFWNSRWTQTLEKNSL